MPKDRTEDRHKTPGYVYRPVPSDLLQNIDELHGRGQRSRVISDLLRRYFAGKPMPKRGEAGAD